MPPHRRASRLEAFLQEHIKIVRLPELLGDPFQSPLEHPTSLPDRQSRFWSILLCLIVIGDVIVVEKAERGVVLLVCYHVVEFGVVK